MIKGFAKIFPPIAQSLATKAYFTVTRANLRLPTW
jgi:hypothetical protein